MITVLSAFDRGVRFANRRSRDSSQTEHRDYIQRLDMSAAEGWNGGP
jgi:hypothetical protein